MNARSDHPGDEKPFGWYAIAASKVLRRYQEENGGSLMTMFGFYNILTEIIQEENAGSPHFSKTHRELCTLSKLGIGTVKTLLKIFRDLDLLTWEQTKANNGTQELDANRYTLLSLK
jgi:hypothetical protein